MSQPHFQRDDFTEALERELRRWPGVTYTVTNRSKHRCFMLALGRDHRMVITSATPSDSLRGTRNFLRDVRGELRNLGAECTVERKAARAKARPPRKPRAPLKLVVDNTPTRLSRDPFAALADLKIPSERLVHISDPKPPKPSFWDRVRELVGWPW